MLVKVTLVQPGKRQWRSRRITSRRWASVGSRRARPSYMVCPTSSSTPMAMVASQAIRRTTSVLIRPSRSRSPARAFVSALLVEQGGQRDVDDHEVGAGRCVARPAGVRRADQLHEGVTEALVPRGLPVGGDLARPGLEAGPGLGEGLGGQLDAHGAVLLVEAHEAPLVLRAARRLAAGEPARRRERATSASWRTECSWAASASSRSVSGVATSATALTLSKDTSPAQSEPTRWGRSQAFSPTRRQRPGARRPRPRSARRPRTRATSPPRRGRPGAGRPRPSGPRSSPRRRPSGERTRRAVDELLVRQGGSAAITSAPAWVESGQSRPSRTERSASRPKSVRRSRLNRSVPPCSGRVSARPSGRSPPASPSRPGEPGGCSA